MLGPCAEAQRTHMRTSSCPAELRLINLHRTSQAILWNHAARNKWHACTGEGREGGRGADTDGRRHGRTESIGSKIRARWSENYFSINSPESEVRAATRNFSSEKTKTATIQNYLYSFVSPLSTLYLYLNICISFSCSIWIHI